MERNKTIRVLIWQDIAGRYFPDGAYRDLSCAHTTDGTWGINMSGEVIPTGTATVPVSQPGTQFQKDSLGVSAGHVYSSTTRFADAGFKATIRVKDMAAQNSYYVDLASYNEAIDQCNACCEPQACAAPVPEITAGPTDSTVSIAWPAVEGVVGYEWVNAVASGDCVDPTGDGTFTTDLSVDLTDLVVVTDYCFAVRAICGAGRFSGWAFVPYTTTS